MIENIVLPKWPGFLVIGESVTPDQAKEIIIRSDEISYFSTNDHDFAKKLYGVTYNISIPMKHGIYGLWDLSEDNSPYNSQHIANIVDVVNKKYGILTDLKYLKNSQIASCYIGGAHGWCNWDGKILSNSMNIGKWPDAVEVLKEWEIIAEAFPFLDLKCQLLSNEIHVADAFPLIEYTIKDGKVNWRIPEKDEEFITPIVEFDDSVLFGKENGCTIDEYINALAVTENSVNYKRGIK